MLKVSYVFLVVTLLTGCAGNEHVVSAIATIDSFEQALPVLAECDADTLVTFDVDDTLITSRDALARNCYFPLGFVLKAVWRYPELLKPKRFEWAASVMYEQAERSVFDSSLLPFMEQLKKRGCKIIGLTSMESGSYGVIPSMPEWRASMLKGFGIVFDAGYANTKFSHFPQRRGDYPMLYKGILCANQQNKAAVLGAFLDHFHVKPKYIISFDDDPTALEGIAKECAKRGIIFRGYHYCGAQKVAKPWDTEKALTQLEYLMEQGRWLNDAS